MCNSDGYYAPAQGGISDDAVWRVCLTSVAYIRSAAGVCGWMAYIDWSGPARPAWLKAAAARFRWRAWTGAYRGGRPPTACYDLLRKHWHGHWNQSIQGKYLCKITRERI